MRDLREDILRLEPSQDPLHQRGRAQGRDEGHDHERGVEVRIDDPRRESDLREEEFHHPTGVQANPEGDQGPPAEPREQSADDPAEQLPEERDYDDRDD